MIKKVEFRISELNSMKKYPKELFYIGDLELLKKPKISIVGSRRPIAYTKNFTAKLSNELSKRDVCIVSGAAMGVDSIAHKSASSKNTIAVMANGLDIRYPSVNKSLIQSIEEEGLCLSMFKEGESSKSWNFVLRNELVVALGEVLIVTQADEKSGSMRSVEYACKMDKKIYVLPHRAGESEGTNRLLKDGLATAIYDVDEFVSSFGMIATTNDELLEFCKTNPSLNETLSKFGNRVYEYELEGKIAIENGALRVI